MAFFRSLINVFSIPSKQSCAVSLPFVGPNTVCQRNIPVLISERSKYTDWRMLRDVKRRVVVKEYAKLRLQINCLRNNIILPKEIKEIAQKEIEALPTDSCTTKLHKRCVLTSRARGRYRQFRMSRIIWRHFADYNQISGVERAMWSVSR